MPCVLGADIMEDRQSSSRQHCCLALDIAYNIHLGLPSVTSGLCTFQKRKGFESEIISLAKLTALFDFMIEMLIAELKALIDIANCYEST